MNMKIKRQKQIKAFLIEEFGEDRGSALFAMQEETLNALVAGENGKSQSQMKTLTQTIFPCIALYKALAKKRPFRRCCVQARAKIHDR